MGVLIGIRLYNMKHVPPIFNLRNWQTVFIEIGISEATLGL